MRCGISTACMYPQDTSQSLHQLTAMRPGLLEVFLNTFRELDETYISTLQETLAATQSRLTSLHPFSSGFEPFLFFTEYEGRFEDGVKLYRRFFEVCRQLGAPLLVLHGDYRAKPGDMKFYASRFAALAKIGAEEYGITLAQENVDRCRCGLPENILLLREYTGDTVKFVLDVKQARRAEQDVFQIVQAMGPENICHLHLSDELQGKSCALPGQGTFDFETMLRYLWKNGCRANAVIELYRDGFDTPQQLVQAADWVDTLMQKIEKEELL